MIRMQITYQANSLKQKPIIRTALGRPSPLVFLVEIILKFPPVSHVQIDYRFSVGSTTYTMAEKAIKKQDYQSNSCFQLTMHPRHSTPMIFPRR